MELLAATDEAWGWAKAWVNDQADGNGPKPGPESVRGERLPARVNEPVQAQATEGAQAQWDEVERVPWNAAEGARESEEKLERESEGEWVTDQGPSSERDREAAQEQAHG